MRRLTTGSLLIFSVSLSLAACGDDTDGTTKADAGPDTAALVARGSYLVNHVLACGDCHTPLKVDNTPDTSKAFAGVECFIDVIPPADNAKGCLHTRNLTNDTTGLKNRSDAEIKAMFQTGVRPGGTFLNSVMPYYIYKNMTDEDASSIVAYLRTLAPIVHQVPANEQPWDNVPAAADLTLDSEIPAAGGTGATHDSAVRGRYLAKLVCIDCHTEATTPGSSKPLKYEKAFQGGRPFTGFPMPPFPQAIYTANLTPDTMTGLGGWTAADVVKVLKMGLDREGKGVCPPMPSGPSGPFGGMTDADATDIANYILNLPAAKNMLPNTCSVGP